jgi:hypothetical protein
MRATLNAILAFIGTTSLTDEEFDSMDVDEESNSRDIYEALLLILDARGDIVNYQERLRYYYLAKGTSFEAATGKSNIFVGSSL